MGLTISKDPVYAADRFLSQRDDLAFPNELRTTMNKLSQSVASLAKEDNTGWSVFYRQMLDTARQACKLLSASTMTSQAPGASPFADEEEMDAAKRIRYFLKDIEQADRTSVAYLINDRTPRQRDEIGDLIDKIAEGVEIEEKISGKEMKISLPGDRKELMSSQLKGALQEWKKKAVQGYVAHMGNRRKPVLDQINESMLKLGIDAPPLIEPGYLQEPRVTQLPDKARGEIIPFITAFMRVLRSGTSMIFLGIMVATRLLPQSVMKEGTFVLYGLIPLFIVVALTQTLRTCEAEKKKLSRKLNRKLKGDIVSSMKKSANDTKSDIQGTIKSLQNKQDQEYKAWHLALEDRLNRIIQPTGTSPAMQAFDPLAGRRRTLADQLSLTIIPGLEQRLKELS